MTALPVVNCDWNIWGFFCVFSHLFKLISAIIRQLHDRIAPKCFMSGTLYIWLSGGCQDSTVLNFRVTLGVHGITIGNFLGTFRNHFPVCFVKWLNACCSCPVLSDKVCSHFLAHWPQSGILKMIKGLGLSLGLILSYIQCDWNAFICNISRHSIFHKLPQANNIMLCLLHPTLSNIWMVNFLKPYWSFI